MKAQAIALCDPVQPGPNRPWKNKEGLMDYLKSL